MLPVVSTTNSTSASERSAATLPPSTAGSSAMNSRSATMPVIRTTESRRRSAVRHRRTAQIAVAIAIDRDHRQRQQQLEAHRRNVQWASAAPETPNRHSTIQNVGRSSATTSVGSWMRVASSCLDLGDHGVDGVRIRHLERRAAGPGGDVGERDAGELGRVLGRDGVHADVALGSRSRLLPRSS